MVAYWLITFESLFVQWFNFNFYNCAVSA